MDVRITGGKTDACTVSVPPSKSYTHRLILAAALAAGESRIGAYAGNEDVEATICCLRAAGIAIEEDSGLCIRSEGSFSFADDTEFYCGESGTTLRFLIPVLSLASKRCVFSGGGILMERPLDVYERLFSEQGLRFERKDGKLITEGRLRGGELRVRGDISSQFISGLLFALPLLEEDSRLRIEGSYGSRSYVRLSEQVLEEAGIRIYDHGSEIHIPGRQKYRCLKRDAEGDDSAAANFLVLACLREQEITVLNMAHDSVQGDRRIIELLKQAGAVIEEVTGGYRIRGKKPRGIRTSLSDCPDLGPLLFALASCSEEESVFTDAGRLRYKESDRIAVMAEELGKLGVRVEADGDTVRISGRKDLKPAEFDAHHDHRTAMALSVLAAGTGGEVLIRGAECVNKSYPGFYQSLAGCGVGVFEESRS